LTAKVDLRQISQYHFHIGGETKGIKAELQKRTCQLNARKETREEYKDPDHPFWYRAILPIPELPKRLFVEIKLID
jgi:hypothetical protein